MKKHSHSHIIQPRLIPRNEDEIINVVAIGRKRIWMKDTYARLLASSWKQLSVVIILLYFSTNLLFGLAYLAIPGGIENARPGSFQDAFFFSVQTLATIGYGKMAPIGIRANLLVTVEALLGFCFYATITGMVFSKFSRPTSRIIFSKFAVVFPYEGRRHLMMRLANERGNRIVDAKIQMVLLRNEISKEGHKMRRFHDLKLLRTQIPLLLLTWTVMHPIDEESPFYNSTIEDLTQSEAEIIISLTGLDETLSQTIHARYSYMAHEVLFDHVFEDIMERDSNKLQIHYDRFDIVKPYLPPTH